MMRRIFALTLACTAFAATPAAAQQADPFDGNCATPGGARLYVNIEGLKDRTGRLKLELYPPEEDDFLKDDTVLKNEGKVFRRVWAPVPASGPVRMCIRTPGTGLWAVLFTHDRDGRNKFNFWEDGAGLPNNNRLGRNRPRLRQALVNLTSVAGQITVRTQYLRGLGGFGPVSTSED
jgi:uncharacterized protein (DUF2141 family)